MTTFLNGQRRTAEWESLGYNCQFLADSIIRYQDHLSRLSKDTYNKFKQLKADYDQGFIDQGTYHQFLSILKGFFEKNLSPIPSDLHAEAIMEEIKKQLG